MVALRVRGDELVMESSFAAVRELLWAEVDARPELFDGAAGLAASVFERGGSERVDRDRVAAVLHGLYWLVADLAERGPIALLVDDAHWLDAASARFLAYLARRIDSLPVLLAVGVRAGDDSTGLAATLSDAAANVLRPEPLSEEAAEVVVRGVLGPGADEELCRACHEATGGNPYYLRELTTALLPERGRGRARAGGERSEPSGSARSRAACWSGLPARRRLRAARASDDGARSGLAVAPRGDARAARARAGRDGGGCAPRRRSVRSRRGAVVRASDRAGSDRGGAVAFAAGRVARRGGARACRRRCAGRSGGGAFAVS